MLPTLPPGSTRVSSTNRSALGFRFVQYHSFPRPPRAISLADGSMARDREVVLVCRAGTREAKQSCCPFPSPGCESAVLAPPIACLAPSHPPGPGSDNTFSLTALSRVSHSVTPHHTALLYLCRRPSHFLQVFHLSLSSPTRPR